MGQSKARQKEAKKNVDCKTCGFYKFKRGDVVFMSATHDCKAVKEEYDTPRGHFMHYGNAEIINANNDCDMWKEKKPWTIFGLISKIICDNR